MKRVLFVVLLLCTACLGGLSSLQAQIYHEPNHSNKPKEEPKKTKYEELLTKHKVDSAASSFVKLYKTDGKVFLELKKTDLNKGLLMGTTVSSISNPSLAELGYKQQNPLHVQFIKRDSVIVLEEVNNNFESFHETEEMKASALLNFTNKAMTQFGIYTENADSTAYVLDITNFVMNGKSLLPKLSPNAYGENVHQEPNSSLDRITEVKAFEDNACIKFTKNYLLSPQNGAIYGLPRQIPCQMGVNLTILRLPEEAMTPRLLDTRIGYFLTKKLVRQEGVMKNLYFIKRWRVEPKDSIAFAQGKLTEAKKPIVYYVEDTFPEMWKKAINEGILKWNKAFERIGFKNVVQVKPFPKDDPSFDPDNFKYSCIRYIPIPVMNARGPSWVDPRSGEIINASVLVYHDISELLNQWRFVQTAQVDKRVRSVKLPEDIMRQSIAYVMTHEVGHTLGLLHNMGSSVAFPVDSLRSPSFTHKYGTTPSVMDYARFNYIAQPEDKGVALTPPNIGIYDFFAIEWGYKYFPNLGQDYRKEQKVLSEMLREKEGDPRYRYGTQQFRGARLDPSAVEEDLGDDPVKASDYGFKNLAYINNHLGAWINAQDDETSEHKLKLYKAILMQGYRYIRRVHLNVYGVYLYQVSESSRLPRYSVVLRDEQRASALWLLKQAKNFSSLANTELEAKLPCAAERPYQLFSKRVQMLAVDNTRNLALSYYLNPNSYAPKEYCEDVFHSVFEKTLAGQENLTADELSLQSVYLDYLTSTLAFLKPQRERRGQRSVQEEASNEEEITEQAEFRCFDELDGELEANTIEAPSYSFGNGYGGLRPIWTGSIDQSSALAYAYMLQTEALLERAIKQCRKTSLREHYAYLLHRIKIFKE